MLYLSQRNLFSMHLMKYFDVKHFILFCNFWTRYIILFQCGPQEKWPRPLKKHWRSDQVKQMQFSKTFSNGIKTEEERLKGHGQWPIFVNRSNRCSSKVAGLGLEKTSQPIWKTQFIIFTGLFFTQKIWRILTAFFQR